MFTLYWTKCVSIKLPSRRFTVSTFANSYTELTGWAGWKKWTLPPSPTLRFPLAQYLLKTVLSLPGLHYFSKEKERLTSCTIYSTLRWIPLSKVFTTATSFVSPLFFIHIMPFPTPHLFPFPLSPAINLQQVSQQLRLINSSFRCFPHLLLSLIKS